MIQTTLGRIFEAEPALTRLLAIKFDKPNGAKLRYHVVKLAQLAQVELAHFYEERNALVEKFGEGDPKIVTPTCAHWSEYLVAVNQLGAVPVSLFVDPITNCMVEPYPEIMGTDLIALGPLFLLEEPAV